MCPSDETLNRGPVYRECHALCTLKIPSTDVAKSRLLGAAVEAKFFKSGIWLIFYFPSWQSKLLCIWITDIYAPSKFAMKLSIPLLLHYFGF